MLKLSILDFADIAVPTLGKLCTTLELARHAEALGFHRFWLAEHYNANASHIDAMMLTFAVASVTERIRVGPAGVLMPFSPAFQTASSARMLEAFFDDRIDLGLAAGGAQNAILSVLRDDGVVGDPYVRVEQTLGYLRNQNSVRTVPASHHPLPVWLLGNGQRMASMAASLGTRLCISLAHRKTPPGPDVLAGYRDAFRPQDDCGAPEAAVLVAGVCGETDAEAAELRALHTNDFVHPSVVGSPERCREQLISIAEMYGVREIVWLDVTRSVEAREHSLRRLAAGCRLEPPIKTD